jgi:uncharacterized protein YndB with AHSA1/START domain
MTPEFVREVKAHLNETDHRLDLRDIAKAQPGFEWAEDAELEDIDLGGLGLVVRGGASSQTLRLNWPTPAQHSGELEARFMELLAAAKAALGQPLQLLPTDLYGVGQLVLPHAPEAVFAALAAVGHYPQWLPMVGVVLASSHNPLQLGTGLSIQPRGQPDVTMQLVVGALEANRVLCWHELGGHQHKLEFRIEPTATGSQLSVGIGSHASVAVDEIAEHNHKLGKVAEVVAKKLQTFLGARA